MNIVYLNCGLIREDKKKISTVINSTLSSDANLQNDWHPYGFLAHLLERRPDNAEVMSLNPDEA